jgi:hypothetical protein
MKKILKYTGITLLVLLLAAILVPLLFKDRILKLVKTEVNKELTAKVDFADLNLSLFRHFPRLTIGLEKLSITGVPQFEGDTLLSAASAEASVSLFEVIGGKELNIHGVYLDAPRVHARVNREGKANWEITRPAAGTDTAAPAAFSMQLKRYALKNGYVSYHDSVSGIKAEISGLTHEGSGNFTQDLFTLSTQTSAQAASFSYGGLPYLVQAATKVDADFEINNTSSKYTFRKAALRVNDLALLADGFLQLVNDSTYAMDLSFNAPANEFKHFLSLVPAIYKTDFDKLKTAGTAAFRGFVRGTYSPQQLPAYEVDLDIRNGSFQYPDLPQPVRNIQVALKASNPDGVMDHTVLNISKGHVEFGNDPFDFRLLFKNPETLRYLDAAIKGRLDLAQVTRFVKLEGGTRLAGLVDADLYAKGNLSTLQQGGSAFAAGGFFNIRNLLYASPSFPQPIQNGRFRVEVQNTGGVADATVVDVKEGHLELGRDGFDFTLRLQRPVSEVDFAGTARGRFTLEGLKQFMTLEPGTSVKGAIEGDLRFAGSKAAIDRGDYGRVEASGTLVASKVDYRSAQQPAGVQVETATLRFSPQQASLQNASLRVGSTSFTAEGGLQNLIGYALAGETLKGSLALAADKVNLAEWMGTPASGGGAASTAPVPVPANVDLTLKARADEVLYDKVTYSAVQGTLLVKDETIRLQDVQTQALGGTLALNGSYSTKQNKQQPAIALSYDVKGVDVQQAFNAFNTVQQLMPLGKFLSGRLTSQFSMKGSLGPDLFPELSSLTGSGNLFLIEGFLSKFQPLDKLAGSLNVAQLKDLSLKDVKAYFEFTNGQVLVKPFNLKVKEIEMQVGGTHGLNQQMNYLMGLKLPRKLLGAGGNNLVNNLAASASSRGIPVSLGETIDLNVKIGGSLTNPTISTDLKQAAGDMAAELKQQAASFVQQKADSAKQTLKDTFQVVKKQVIDDAKSSLIQSITGNRDSASKGASLEETKKKAGETIKNTLGNLLRKKQPADTTKKE